MTPPSPFPVPSPPSGSGAIPLSAPREPVLVWRRSPKPNRFARLLRGLAVAAGVLMVVAFAGIAPYFARSEAWPEAHWDHPYWLLALLAVPPVVWAMTLGADSRMPRLGIATIAPLARGPHGIRSRLRDLPGILRGGVLTLAVVALARPQNVQQNETSEELGIDIVIVLDLSLSMRAVMDAPEDAKGLPNPADPGQPGRLGSRGEPVHGKRPTRLDTAKDVILDFISKRKTDRIGVVVFGRQAFVLSPPTLDYALLASLVQKMQLELIDGSATAIGDAVGTGVARLRRSAARSKTVILLTDGDSNAGKLDPEYAAHLAQTQAVKVYTVQIGTGDWVDVQDSERPFDLFGQPNYKKAHFPVNPELLQRMAQSTGGQSFVASDKAAFEKSMHAILDSLEKTRFEAHSQSMEDLYPYLLYPAAILLLLEVMARAFLLRRFP